MNIQQLIAKSKGFFKKHERKVDGEYMHPVRHWMYGLSVGVVIFVFGVGSIAFDFYNQFGIETVPGTPIDQQVTYPEKEVRRLTDQYKERQRIFEDLRSKRPVIAPVVEKVEKVEEAPSEIVTEEVKLAE